MAAACWILAASAQTLGVPQSAEPASTGPLHLRQPQSAELPSLHASAPQSGEKSALDIITPAPIAAPGEFERFVKARRVGVDWLAGIANAEADNDSVPLVPPDYVLGVGDELVLTLWGSIDSDLALRVDRSGRIVIPRVGPLLVAGMRYGDLADAISRRVSQVFKNFQLSVSLGKLRAVRVFVTGFATRPGALVLNSLSSVTQALARAGGPSAAGSYRSIELRRGRELVATLDLYDLLLRGNRQTDMVLQPNDVIHVAPIGDQVALLGSVNRPAVFELKAGEKLADVLRMAAGFTAVADSSRVSLERVNERHTRRVTELALPGSESVVLQNGDVLRAFSAVTAIGSTQNQNKRVQIDGEVLRPGFYILPPGSTLLDALQSAGGLAPSAFLYGAEFSRESVRITQQANYDRALRDLESEVARANTAARGQSSGDFDARAGSLAQVFDRLRAIKPNGRVVLQTPLEGGTLPALVLEDGDRLIIPSRPTTVGLFGSVFNTGNYLYSDGRKLDDYLRLAGGMTRSADERNAFVVHANGSVVSTAQQGGGWLSSGRSQFAALPAEPGDTIFVPDEWGRVPVIQSVKDWTQILYQFGLGVAGIKAAFR